MAKKSVEVENVTRHVKKYGVKRNGTGVSCEYNEVRPFANNGGTVVSKISANFGYLPTPGFDAANRRLVPHLVRIMEIAHAWDISLSDHYIALSSDANIETYAFKDYFVTGVTFRDEGVAIQGGRLLKSGQVQPINTPFMRFKVESLYENIAELEVDAMDALGECGKYLGGNYLAPPQLSMDFDQGKADVDAEAA